MPEKSLAVSFADPDPHQNEKQDPDPRQSEKDEALEMEGS
jgi:hypothetical protein